MDTNACAVGRALEFMRASPCACGRRPRAGPEVVLEVTGLTPRPHPPFAGLRVEGTGRCTVCGHRERFVCHLAPSPAGPE